MSLSCAATSALARFNTWVPWRSSSRQLLERGLDPVERGEYVDPADRDGAGCEPALSGVREPRSIAELLEGAGESAVRLRRLAEDDDRRLSLDESGADAPPCFDRCEAPLHHDHIERDMSKNYLRTT